MGQHLAHRVMLIGQFVDAIIVRIQAQAQSPQDQDSPLLHPRSALFGTGQTILSRTCSRWNHPFQNFEHGGADFRGNVDIF